MGATPEILGLAESLRRLDGAGVPADRRPGLLIEALTKAAGAEAGLLLEHQPRKSPRWLGLAFWPSTEATSTTIKSRATQVEEVCDTCLREAVGLLQNAAGPLGAVRIESSDAAAPVTAAFIFSPESDAAEIRPALQWLHVAVNTPPLRQLMGREGGPNAGPGLPQLVSVLDLLVALNAQKKFLGLAMACCNELCAQMRATRVTLGWKQGDYLRLKAASHMERFEKKMEAVRSLEAAMEEAADQDREILWPLPTGDTAITRCHEFYARQQDSPHLATVPIRLEGGVRGALCLERAGEGFSSGELRTLRLVGDLIGRRLEELYSRDHRIRTRLRELVRTRFAPVLGYEHTGAKLLGIGGALLLVVLFLIPFPYRVEAPFSLRTLAIAHMPAPSDGYIKEVRVNVGDSVQENQILLTLDDRELKLQELDAIARVNEHKGAALQAQLENKIGQMRVELAPAEQARAQLELTRYQLERSILRAPFAGLVVSGDLKEKLGAPVKKGDPLFKVARIQDLYVELKVNEKDIHEIREGAPAWIAFAGRPSLKFPVNVERIEPAAMAEEQGNVFNVRCRLAEPPPAWWRPGMTGVAKVSAGWRSLFWIGTHRAIDFLRLKLWW
ncbi:MAG: HlyD family efflux transporter periplasmic adaptor subunit [Verrucomicrobiae bacterium]|nr:HlyD family efflux transporter periplasmic adaptor subunit [Verrucomicrobiae bacterium]